MTHSLLERALISRPLRQAPMSLVVLNAILLYDLAGTDDAPKCITVEGLTGTLRSNKGTIRRSLELLVQECYLIRHSRTGRGIGLYSLGNGVRVGPLRVAAPLPQAREAA